MTLAGCPPIRLARRSAPKALQHNQDCGLEDALRYETFGLELARCTRNEVKESRAALREKRKGAYTGG